MNPHVYDAREVRSHLHLLGQDGGVVLRAPMTKVSPAGGILKCNLALKRDQILNARLEIGEQPEIKIKAQVLRTGRTGVFVAWYPPDAELHSQLEAALTQELKQRDDSDATAWSDPSEVEARRPTDALNIRERARAVSSLDLAARHKTVHVLDLSTIQQMMDQAVADALKQLGTVFGEEERERLREESERNFEERVAALKAEKSGLESKVEHLETQLLTASDALEEERQRVIQAERFTVSDAGMIQLEQRFERIVERLGREGRIPSEMDEDLRQVVQNLLDDERERIAQQAREAHGDTLSLLERKVTRLAQTLEETREERDAAQERAHALETAAGPGGLRNVVQPGMKTGDPLRTQKLALLEQLVADNKQLREHARGRAKAVTTETPDREAG